MPFELDHVFVCTSVDAPEAARLATVLTAGRSGSHAGQGTANRCFVFRNAYLELIWVHAPDEALSASTARTRLFDRWSGRANATCPFGICLRPAHGSVRRDPPFATWDYVPAYTTTTNPIRIGLNSDRLDEPMLFFLQGASRPDSRPQAPAMTHPLGIRELTRLTWTRTGDAPLSAEMQAVVDGGCLDVATGAAHALDLTFDAASAGKRVNLLPDLPLTLRF